MLRPYIAVGEDATYSQMLGTLGYNDLSGALRQRMGRSFAGVTPVPFSMVALLSIVYMLLLGPASYWVAHHFGGRPALAWVLFPLLVLAGSGAAFWYGLQAKGAVARVNELELVDCDQTTGQARGIYWAVMYSPESARFELSLDVKSPAEEIAPQEAAAGSEASQTLLSWWGLPGVGIGGMQAGGINLTAGDASYRFAPERDALEGMPILASATKSLSARWTAPIKELIDNDLADDDGMLAGTLVNASEDRLLNARLLYGTWAYRLGQLEIGEQVEVGQHLDPIKVQTLITQMARGSATTYADRGRFLAERATTDELLALMMFYRAAGGQGFANLPNRYQSFFDLSRLVELGRAVLVAEVESAAAQLVNPANGERLTIDEEPRRVMRRFVLPVERSY